MHYFMNFYPQWSTQHLYVDPKGRLAYRAHEEDGAGFAAVINDYYQRYKAPIIITETSAFGSEELRARWLKSSVEAVKYLRGQRVPVVGYTWFPMFTMIDWRYRHGQSPLEHYRLELGLYRLSDDPAAAAGRWIATPLVEQVQNYIAKSAEYVGTLDSSALANALNTDACKAHSHATQPEAATFTGEQPRPELVEGD